MLFLYTFRKIGDMKKVNDTKLDFFTNIVYEVRTSTNSIIGLCNEAENENVISIFKESKEICISRLILALFYKFLKETDYKEYDYIIYR